jgi:hypothetical protein
MKKEENVNKTTKPATGATDDANADEPKEFLDQIPSDDEDEEMTKEEIFGDTPNYETMNKRDIVTGADLDVPGAMLDDSMEDIGSEDEENNYYSLGGDNHEGLEESKE